MAWVGLDWIDVFMTAAHYERRFFFIFVFFSLFRSLYYGVERGLSEHGLWGVDLTVP